MTEFLNIDEESLKNHRDNSQWYSWNSLCIEINTVLNLHCRINGRKRSTEEEDQKEDRNSKNEQGEINRLKTLTGKQKVDLDLKLMEKGYM